ncbi:unnamed protein product [Tetraodon nigroviridis]|uniref:(spotted green pufferfish) hypothetical protein n=1 Tax=Tetraodon nigroviridis TaxID=99883 RepID=Q4T4Y4_TETNG|nr:unnamed protein product [Tetraodon nigroviridis]
MSAEAADRVAAVASSRPSTPLQTSWFEFLLDGSLLEKHLQKTNPAMAVVIYNRWLNILQQEKEMTENILTVLKEQANDSISVLEGALHLKKDFYVHTLRTLDLLAADTAANGETESSTAGLCITADELHCQVGGPHSRYQSTDFSFFKRTCIVMGCLLFFFGFRFIMTWEVFSSTGAAQTRQPIEKPVITSDRPKIC